MKIKKEETRIKKTSILTLLAFMAIAISILTWYESTQGPPGQPIQLAAANSLTDQEESLVPVSPKDSKVEIVAITEEIEGLINHTYNKRKVYKVTFNHTATESNGNLTVFVDTDKKTVVGKGFENKAGLE